MDSLQSRVVSGIKLVSDSVVSAQRTRNMHRKKKPMMIRLRRKFRREQT
jgi:hypothetical protein